MEDCDKRPINMKSDQNKVLQTYRSVIRQREIVVPLMMGVLCFVRVEDGRTPLPSSGPPVPFVALAVCVLTSSGCSET